MVETVGFECARCGPVSHPLLRWEGGEYAHCVLIRCTVMRLAAGSALFTLFELVVSGEKLQVG